MCSLNPLALSFFLQKNIFFIDLPLRYGSVLGRCYHLKAPKCCLFGGGC